MKRANEENEPGEPSSTRARLRDAIEFASGGHVEEQAAKPELPGFFSFARRYWKERAHAGGGFFARMRGFNAAYREAKEQEVKKLRAYEAIAAESKLDKEFMLLLFVSTCIATFGLLQGSSATVIAAEILAPLMMPILGFSVAAIWGDKALILRSSLTLGVGVVLAVFVSTLLSAVVPGVSYTTEITSRTNPTLYDLLIALAAGLVAAYAYVNPRISPAIPGVAIANASVPPLCTAGIAFGRLDFTSALGALLLFASNMVAIALSASFVFWRMRVHPVSASEAEVDARAQRNVLVTSVLLIVIAVPLGWFMYQTYTLKRDGEHVRAMIADALPEAEVLSLDLRRLPDGYHVKSVIVVATDTKDGEVARLEKRIRRRLEGGVATVKLIVLASHPGG